MEQAPLTTRAVCLALQLSETALRHALRRPGAPKPKLHPTCRVFLWTRSDVERLAVFLGRPPRWPADSETES